MSDENRLLAPWYAPNLSYCNHIFNNEIVFCGKIRHQKRSYRNRTEILNANGRLRLTIP
ncbi:MAG: WbqC family protein, partial [Bacteroidetes bacterium]|nr:WbqC family protein [Bacteroidota bacterium]